MEKFLIKNMWKIIFSLWIIIFLTWLIPLINLPTWWIINAIFWIEQVKKIISTEYMFTTLWAIFAFWYWYKKYERDKEMVIVEKYVEKYDKFKNIENIEERYTKLFDLFYEEFYLYESNQINENLWKIWFWWMKIDMLELLDYDKINNKNLLDNIIEKNLKYNFHNANIKHWKNYIYFIKKLIFSINNELNNEINLNEKIIIKFRKKLFINKLKIIFFEIKFKLFKIILNKNKILKIIKDNLVKLENFNLKNKEIKNSFNNINKNIDNVNIKLTYIIEIYKKIFEKEEKYKKNNKNFLDKIIYYIIKF